MTSVGQVELGYIELSRKLLQDAYRKKMNINSIFPSVVQIAEQYGVNRITIEQAFKELIKEDYCYSLNGTDMHLKKSPEELGRSCFTYGIVLGYPRVDEEVLPFYRNLYRSVEKKIIEDNDDLLCLHDWTKKSIVRKKQELDQFTSHISGYIGIGLFHEKDCRLLQSSGVSSVVVDLDATISGLDCVVFDNEAIMGKLMSAVIAEIPEAIYYIDFSRSTNYDPAVEERSEVFSNKYAKYFKRSSEKSSLVLSIAKCFLNELSPFLDHMKKAIGRVHLVCADDSVALNVCQVLESVGIVAGKDFDLAYIGPALPREELQKFPAIIGVLDERGLGVAGFELLKERIEKGRGPIVLEKISGGATKWIPKKYN